MFVKGGVDMILKEYEVSVKTNGFDTNEKENLFIKKFVEVINNCNYKKVPATMIPVSKEQVTVINKVYTAATVSVIVRIQKPENEEVILKNLYKIGQKINAELIDVKLIKSY